MEMVYLTSWTTVHPMLMAINLILTEMAQVWLSRNVKTYTVWHVHPKKTQIGMRVHTVWSEF